MGLGKLPSTSKARSRRLGRLLMKSAAEAIVCVFGSLRSAPAEKAPPASSPVRTAQRTSSSSSMARKCFARPSLKSAPHALRDLGRLSVTRPMGPRFSKTTGMGESLSSLGGGALEPDPREALGVVELPALGGGANQVAALAAVIGGMPGPAESPVGGDVPAAHVHALG